MFKRNSNVMDRMEVPNYCSIQNINQRTADLQWAIGLNQKILKVIGLWTYTSESKWQTIRSNFLSSFFALGILTFLIFPQTLALIKVWGNLTLIIDNLIINLPATTSVLKIILPWCNKKLFKDIFREIERDWLKQKNSAERDVMMEYASLGKIMTILGMIGAFLSLAFYHIPLIFGIVPRTITNLTDPVDSRPFPLQSVYLYDTSSTTSYCLTELSEVLGGFLAITAYTGIDVLFGVVVLHTCGQLKNLAGRIEVIGEPDSPMNVQKLLKLHVQDHCRLIRLVQAIEDSCSLMLLALFGSVAITFCVLGFQLIVVLKNDAVEIPLPHVIFYVQFLSYCLFLMFVYSWVGESLGNQSTAIYIAACKCNWTSLHPKHAMQLTLILLRSQYPFQITAGKIAPVNLNTFATLLKTSAGYVSFLLAVME